MKTLAYDVVVVGAGPAGSSAARAAAENGASVLVIERKGTIGTPVQCAEFIPRPLLREVEVHRRCIAREVETMRTHLPSGEISELRSPGYVLDRALFDKSLVLSAIRKGARLLSHTRVTDLVEEGVLAQQGGGELLARARVIVGADGPGSVVGRCLGQTNTRFVHALQYELPLVGESRAAEVYFDRAFPGGYAWLFPKRETANVGVGMSRDDASLAEALDQFVSKLVGLGKVRAEGIVGVTGGVIPVGGYLRTVVGNVLLVGDAAGHTHPITGAGIAPAVICGRIAGEVAAKAALRNDDSILRDYETRWKAIFADVLDKAVAKRRLMEDAWDTSDLDGLERRCWVGFTEYAR